jgi:hypothetical protein
MRREYVLITEELSALISELSTYASLQGISDAEILREMRGCRMTEGLTELKYGRRALLESERLTALLSTDIAQSFLRCKFGRCSVGAIIQEVTAPKTARDIDRATQYSCYKIGTLFHQAVTKFKNYAKDNGVSVVKELAKFGVVYNDIYLLALANMAGLPRLIALFETPIGLRFLAENFPGMSAEDVVRATCVFSHFSPTAVPKRKTQHSKKSKKEYTPTLKVAAAPAITPARSEEIAGVLSKLESLHQAVAIEYGNLQALIKDSSLVSTKSLAELLPKN